MNGFLKLSMLSTVLAFGASTAALAHGHHDPPPPPPPPVCTPNAPEVDPAMAIAGFTLLVGTLTVMRASRRKKLGAN